ncbi:Methyltransferase domain-containing protein [Nocardioides sp. YR527]|uniref:class I SAM-dependent methyltransferase n=1 Tax=Nocardioides sp. YR527 TaxID=1881028 RepID=UPI000890C830|nr:class I SAM-dependent methyltransferase [Nocardioides sp. YR527]SDK87795.1 Methyltransferase domain-containing protein [Nocardioides sp. YR527]
MERSRSFGAVAEDYERFRPGYPDELVALVSEVAVGPVRRAIEIGAGTGKATRTFAAAGIEVVATDPDVDMLGVLRRECSGLPVTAVHAALEELDPAAFEPFDLLYVAAAWHWTAPATRWDLATGLVRDGGAVAFFGGPFVLADHEVAAVEDELIAAYAPKGRHVPAPSAVDAPMLFPGDEMLADGRLCDVREREVPRRFSLARADYVRHLDTVSAVRILPGADRSALFADLAAVLPEQVEVRADLMVHTARRVGDATDS